ncbi:5'-nucleotidase C-terminal domain-containing protein [Paenibacillus sp. KS-LC4]|uniref:5'-nucleotidase C-terminal domain-containing protein n=1 Tax=Paenibacillus sp. KS-LC4 TaxID=2979727 RepID=UPI0030CF6A4C
MNKFKWFTSILLTAALLIGAASVTAAASTQEKAGKHITLLHTNDMHARAVRSESNGELGFAQLAGIIDSYRASNPNTLLLDGGDAIHGTTFATLVEGESVVRVMNAMRYDAAVPGNHEFNYGYNRLVELEPQMEYPLLSANIRVKKDDSPLFQPYVIKEVDGVKIGIFGLTTPETAYKTHPKNVDGLVFTDPAEEAKAIVAELKGQVDVIVALGHIGQDESSADTSIGIVKEVAGIDVFIDGHSHTVLQKGLEGGHGTLIASAGEYTKYIGVVDLWIDQGKVVSKEAKLIDDKAAAAIAPDKKIAELVDSIVAEQQEVLSSVIGETSVKLDGEREQVRAGETNLGNLIADSLRSITKADIAITNGGGIRASIDEGTITLGEIITVLPFGNQIVTLNVTGADIKAALENGVSDYPNPKGAFPQVSGISFKIDTAKAKGSRVHSVSVGGAPLDAKKQYTLATNDFIAAGGDEYTMFASYPQAGMFGALDEALTGYLRELGTVSTAVEGRITEGATPSVASPTPSAPSSSSGGTKPKPQPKPEVIQPGPAAPATDTIKDVPATAADYAHYTVKKGDTLWSIAKRYNTTWQAIRDVNQIKNPDRIYIGQQLKIPV